jgi:D-amino acid aminotransferase
MGDELAWVNGDLVPAAEARLSVFDQGFLYGYGLFETMRSYNGKIFLLNEHLARLARGAAAIGLDAKLKEVDLAAACREAVRANGGGGLRVRLTVTGGDAPGFPWEEDVRPPTVVILVRPFPGYPRERYERGFRACIASVCRCAESAVAGIKSVNYLVTIMARREAAALGLDESILLSDRGTIAEGGNSNVFFVREGKLLTPALDTGILAGITRELVHDLARETGIPYEEAELRPEDLAGLDEAFFTSSVIEVMPLVSVRLQDGQTVTFNEGKPGEVTRRLMAAYAERVKRETGG